MEDLSTKRCVPCEGNAMPLDRKAAESYLATMQGWELIDEGHAISKSFTFPDFQKTMEFVNGIAKVAEEEGHHPDLGVSYGEVTVELSTHAIGGLSENDFILAAKIDKIQK